MTHDDVIIQNVVVENTPDLASFMFRVDMRAIVLFRWDPHPRQICASMMIREELWEERDKIESYIYKNLMELIVKEINKERDKHREQLQNVHTPESLRSLLTDLETARDLGGYGGAVRFPFPPIYPSIPDPPMGRSHWDVSGSGSGGEYESYDDGWGGAPPGRGSRV